ncbi:MAG: hypothetical protein PHN41_01440 [Bacteroidales bacterium]|jgi:hypothetical protein|nr:hypothetical protein [Bacteroidales bacterium]MDD4703016.1 hypothetical protein [Bacteroidales bacterium]MDX9798199.1 hypothetical protein [Bacteroidales bacterium]
MKKVLPLIIVLFVSLLAFSQEESVAIEKEFINDSLRDNAMPLDYEDPVQYRIDMGTSFGKGFFSESFVSTYIAPSVIMKVNPQSWLRAGVLTGDSWINMPKTKKPLEDKAPYENRYKRNMAYVGMDFEINPRLLVSVTAFWDNFSPMSNMNTLGIRDNLYTYGFNANLTYQITENSYFNLGFTFVESNNPYSLMPYRYGSPMSAFSPMFTPYGHHNNFLINTPYNW